MTSSTAAIRNPGDPVVSNTYDEENWNSVLKWQDNPYYFGKKESEISAIKFAKRINMPLVTLCPSAIVGPPVDARSSGSSFSIEIIKKMINGSFPLLPHVYLGWVDVKDVARAHVLALEHDDMVGRFIVSSEDKWLNEIGLILKNDPRLKKLPIPTKEMPDWMALGSALFTPSLSVRAVRVSLGRKEGFSNQKLVSQFEKIGAEKLSGVKVALTDTAVWLVDNGHVKVRAPGSRRRAKLLVMLSFLLIILLFYNHFIKKPQ